MFTLKVDLSKENPNRFNKFISEGLSNSKYSIYFSYDQDKEIITYEAALKDIENTTLPLYLKCSISSFGEILKDSSYDLLAYICEKDQDLYKEDQDKFNEIYASINNKVEKLIELDNETLKKRNEARNKFSDLVQNLIDADSPLTDCGGMVSLYPILVFRNNNASASLLKLKIGVGNNKYDVGLISNLLDAIRNEKIVSYAPEFTFKHTLDAFTKEARDLIKILPNVIVGGYKEEIKPDGMVTLIDSMKGQNIVLTELGKNDASVNKGVALTIDTKEIEASIFLNKDGFIEINPEPEGLVINGQGKSVYINMMTRRATLLCFKSGVIQKIYAFATENPLFNYNDVKDIIKSKLFPLIDGKTEVDEEYRKKNTITDFIIKLSIDLLDDDSLYFKTEYYLSGTPISRNEAISNFAYSKRIQEYESILGNFGIPSIGRIRDQNIIGSFLSSDLTRLRKVAEIVTSNYLKTKPIKVFKPIHLKATYEAGWLDLAMDNGDYTRDEIKAILEAFKEKRSFARLKDKVVFFDDEQMASIERFRDELGITSNTQISRKIPLYEIFNLHSYGKSFALEMSEDVRGIVEEIKNYKEATYKPTENITATLRSYQLDGFKWLKTLYKYNLGGILADDMGLGKTLQLITLIDSLDINMPILVVSPKSVLYNWENEINTFAPNLKSKIIVGTKSQRVKTISSIKQDKKVVYLTSYDSVRNDLEEFKGVNFALIALDEAQYIKNSTALKTKAVKELNSNVRFVLTGTPIENSLTDIWSIFDFLMPGYLFTEKDFIEEYENEITINASELARKKLQAKIAPFVLRRTKSEVLKDLPPKIEMPLYVSFEDSQKRIYDACLFKARNSIGLSGKIEILAALTRLREICVDPIMFDETFSELPVKFDVTINTVRNAIESGHKVLIFSSFRTSLEHLKAKFDEENIISNEIYGSTSAKDRLEIAKEFNREDSETKVLLISLKAGGTGLNLVGADIVIHLDPWWNVAAENQASDRAHRIGQKNSVTVIKMVVKNTIEEKVLLLQKQKQELVDMIIREGENAISSLSDEDIKFLLS